MKRFMYMWDMKPLSASPDAVLGVLALRVLVTAAAVLVIAFIIFATIDITSEYRRSTREREMYGQARSIFAALEQY